MIQFFKKIFKLIWGLLLLYCAYLAFIKKVDEGLVYFCMLLFGYFGMHLSSRKRKTNYSQPKTPSGFSKKLKFAIVILIVGYLAIESIKQQDIETFGFGIVILLFLYAVLKIGFWANRKGWLDTTTQPPRYTTRTTYNAGNTFDARRAAKQAADQRVWERTKAQNDAIYQQYQAKKNAGTYAGYQAENRAKAARNRANNY